MSILKELLANDAFESKDFIDDRFILTYIPYILEDPKYSFLLNILSFEESLLNGSYNKRKTW